MGYKSFVGFGILAAGFVVGAGVSAPVATAAELPPGLTCGTNFCKNDTDDNYLVRGTVVCHEPFSPPSEPVEFLVTVHNFGRPSPSCSTGGELADGTAYTRPSDNYTLYADSAVVHNAPYVKTGSAG